MRLSRPVAAPSVSADAESPRPRGARRRQLLRAALAGIAGGVALHAGAASPEPLPGAPPGWPPLFHLGVMDAAGDAAALAAQAPWGFRYHYLAGGVNTGWHAQNPTFVADYVAESLAAGIVPVLADHMLPQPAPGAGQGEPAGLETNLLDADTMRAYDDGVARAPGQASGVPGGRVVLHVEPDLWGHVQQRLGDGGAATPAVVAASGRAELAGLPDTDAGFAQAFVRLRDRYAPGVLLAYHLSAWGTDRDFRGQDDATVDALAARAAAFYRSLGAPFDLVFAEFSDRDAGFKQYVEGDGGASWWAPADFERHARFLEAFVRAAGRRVVLWQLPLGNTRMRALNDTWGHCQDNRVEGVDLLCWPAPLDRLPALARGVPVPAAPPPTRLAAALALPLPVGAPAGTYDVVLFLAVPGGGAADGPTVLSLATARFEVGP